jgi:hypothetical protein
MALVGTCTITVRVRPSMFGCSVVVPAAACVAHPSPDAGADAGFDDAGDDEGSVEGDVFAACELLLEHAPRSATATAMNAKR